MECLKKKKKNDIIVNVIFCSSKLNLAKESMYQVNAIHALIKYAGKNECVRQGKAYFTIKDVVPNNKPDRKTDNFSLTLQNNLRQVLGTLDALGFARCRGLRGFYQLEEKGYDFLVERMGIK